MSEERKANAVVGEDAAILRVLREQDSAAMLFGSATRADFNANSDIDVLELAQSGLRHYLDGRYSISVYDEPSLLKMAESGSLFVLHLKLDGRIIRDPNGALNRCLAAYRAPNDYKSLRESLSEASNLLDASPAHYNENWKVLHELVIFILRSVLFASYAESGSPTFSIAQIQQRMQRQDLGVIQALKVSCKPSRSDFEKGCALIEEFLHTRIVNDYGSIEAFVVNRGQENRLVLNFGLKLLGDKSAFPNYDLFPIARFSP